MTKAIIGLMLLLLVGSLGFDKPIGSIPTLYEEFGMLQDLMIFLTGITLFAFGIDDIIDNDVTSSRS